MFYIPLSRSHRPDSYRNVGIYVHTDGDQINGVSENTFIRVLLLTTYIAVEIIVYNSLNVRKIMSPSQANLFSCTEIYKFTVTQSNLIKVDRLPISCSWVLTVNSVCDV